jgi:hypothetical protein
MKRMDSRVLSWQTMFQPGGPKPYPNIQPGCHEDLILADSLVRLKLIIIINNVLSKKNVLYNHTYTLISFSNFDYGAGLSWFS